MYSKNNDIHLKYLYIDLINNNNYIDKNQLLDFIELFDNNPDVIFIFDYNCLDYPEIEEVINFLVNRFKDFVLKCENFKQLEKLDSLKTIISELRIKINADIGSEILNHKISNNTKFLDYFLDINKSNILKVGSDLYLNKKNLIFLRETLKILSKNNIESKIIFEEYPLNSYYDTHKSQSNVITDDYSTEILLDNIISDKTLKISNSNNIMYMLYNYMKNKCWTKYYPIQLSISTNFKLKICNKIGVELDDIDLFKSFENGNLKEDVFNLIKDKCKQYCLGCNCEDFISEL